MEFMDFAKTPKYNYLENKTLFVSQIKKFIYYTSRATLLQKNAFVVEETLKEWKRKIGHVGYGRNTFQMWNC